MFIDFRERKRETEKNIDVREKHQLAASYLHLTGDWTRNLLEYRAMLQPTKPPGQGSNWDHCSSNLRFDSGPYWKQMLLVIYSEDEIQRASVSQGINLMQFASQTLNTLILIERRVCWET